MAEHYEPRIGDVVRVGKGKKTWRIESFWTGYAPGEALARLVPVDGYTATSADTTRLTLVERPEATP
jgi:hypothetical protein